MTKEKEYHPKDSMKEQSTEKERFRRHVYEANKNKKQDSMASSM